MAVLFRPNGDAQQVFALDVSNGAQTGNIAQYGADLVQMAGPKLDYFAVIVKNSGAQARDLRNECGNVTDPGAVQTINQTVQNTATIAFYQVENASSGQISYGLYPNAAYTATSLQQAIQATGGNGNIQITNSSGQVRGVDVSGTTATNVGFKLALS